MRIAFDIPDENRNGNCYETAFQNQIDDRSLLVCHGVVRGQGALEGIEFPHAWNETESETVVIDTSNGNDICMMRESYYVIGRIDESTVFKYTYDEAWQKAIDTGTYGPWEPELDFDYREAAMRIADSKARDEAVKQANLWYWKTYVGRKSASDGLGIDDIGEGDEYEDPDTGDRIEVESRTRNAIYYREVPRDRVLMGYEECRVASVGDFLSTVSGWRRS